MKTLILASVGALALSAGAHAQLGDVVGGVRGTVDQSTQIDTRLDSTLNDTADVMVDQRTGMALNADLVSDLSASLPHYAAANANARLRQALEADAAAYGRARATPPRMPRASLRSPAGASMGTSANVRARHEGDYADVRVYSSDGFQVGTVDHVDTRGAGQGRVFVSTRSGGPSKPVASGSAFFDSDANAVVLGMTRSEFSAMGSATGQVGG